MMKFPPCARPGLGAMLCEPERRLGEPERKAAAVAEVAADVVGMVDVVVADVEDVKTIYLPEWRPLKEPCRVLTILFLV